MDSPIIANGQVPVVRVETWWDRLWRPFWALPLAICLAAFLLGLLLPQLDEELDEGLPFAFTGGPDAALSILSTIATSMISVTGLVFTITIVVLQLASNQFTPRVLSTFLSSRITQTTLGVFLATFIYSLTVMRSVRGSFQGTDPFVPQASVTVAFLFVVASLGLFLAFIRHVTTSIQVANVISGVGDRAVQVIDELYPARAGESPVAGPTWSPSPGAARVEIRCSHGHGSVTELDFPALVGLAAEHGAVLDVQVQSGDFVVEGQALARAWGVADLPEEAAIKVANAVGLGPERLMNQDLAFGIRQLVDIADRALSPSLNDPTTACQVVDQLHRILRPLVGRESPSPYVADEAGTVRVVYRPQRIEQLIQGAVGELVHFGHSSPPVVERLGVLLDELAGAANPRYLDTLERQRLDL